MTSRRTLRALTAASAGLAVPLVAMPGASALPAARPAAARPAQGAHPAGVPAPALAASGVPSPPRKALPSALDVAPPYQRGTLCLTKDLPGPTAFAQLLNAHYGYHYYGIRRSCPNAAEHGEGRALDYMLSASSPSQLALGNAITRWLSAPDSSGRPGAMARRFGINYIIWNRQMWRAYDPGRGWAPYVGVSPHTDHIHLSFTWDGAYQRTSWWTGVPVTTPLTGPLSSASSPVVVSTGTTMTSTGYPYLTVGARGADVALAQRAIGTSADGAFGPLTAAAIGTWQARRGIPVTRALDTATWGALISAGLVPRRVASSPTGGSLATALAPYASTTLSVGSRGAAVVALQKALGITADGAFGPLTQGKVKAYQAAKKLPATGVVTPAMWQVLRGLAPAPAAPKPATPPPPGVTSASLTTEFTAYKKTVLTVGSRGTAVKVLQGALGGLAVDGAFGSRTAERVKTFQKVSLLKPTGVVDAATWAKLEASAHKLLPYWGTVLRQGSRGAAVVALQKALRIPADGAFGPQTTAAVKAAQQRARLSATGVVGLLTWKAIEKR